MVRDGGVSCDMSFKQLCRGVGLECMKRDKITRIGQFSEYELRSK